MKIKIYTDGCCLSNGSENARGGWAFVFPGKKKIKSKSGFVADTTNNRMELLSVIKALKFLSGGKNLLIQRGYDSIQIYSDSAYVVNAVNLDWLVKWGQNGWKTVNGKDIKNADLWKELVKYCNELDFFKITFQKVKGHSGNHFNELCDELAKKAAQGGGQ